MSTLEEDWSCWDKRIRLCGSYTTRLAGPAGWWIEKQKDKIEFSKKNLHEIAQEMVNDSKALVVSSAATSSFCTTFSS